MKRSLFMAFTCLLTMATQTTSVMARDNFFKGDARHFIKTDLNMIKGQRHIKFAGCEIQQDKKTANCLEITNINATKFGSMRNCERGWMAANAIGAAAGASASVAIVYGSIVSGGSMAELGFLLLMGTTGFAVNEVALVVEAYRKLGIYASENQNDEDWVTGRSSYTTFLENLKETIAAPDEHTFADGLRCSAFAHTTPVNKKLYRINLTAEQRSMLSKAAKKN